MGSEVSRGGIYRSEEEIPGLETTGLPQRKDSLHPPVALFAGDTLRMFAPQDSEAKHALGMVVRKFNLNFDQEEPKGIDLPMKSRGKLARGVLVIPVKRFKSDQQSMESSPLLYGRRPRHRRILPPREYDRFADQVSKTALPESDPISVDSVTVVYRLPYNSMAKITQLAQQRCIAV